MAACPAIPAPSSAPPGGGQFTTANQAPPSTAQATQGAPCATDGGVAMRSRSSQSAGSGGAHPARRSTAHLTRNPCHRAGSQTDRPPPSTHRDSSPQRAGGVRVEQERAQPSIENGVCASGARTSPPAVRNRSSSRPCQPANRSVSQGRGSTRLVTHVT